MTRVGRRNLCLRTAMWLAVCLAVPPASAHAGMEVRAVVGPSFGFADYDSGGRSLETGNSARIGLYGGFQVVVPVVHPVSIETGVVYGTRGGKTSFDAPIILGDEYTWQLDYVSIPALARWQPAAMYLKAGAVLDLLMRSAYESAVLSSDFDAAGQDVALAGAIGVDGRLGEVPVFVELEGTWGFVDANAMDGVAEIDIRNRTIRVGVGMIFESESRR